MIAERFWNKGEQAICNRTTTAHHQLKCRIKIGRIAEGWINQWPQVTGSFTPYSFEIGFGRTGPIDVAEQRIDFAVVAKQAHGLGQGPAGQRVGTESPVVNSKMHRKTLIPQVGVKEVEYRRADHAFVDDGTGTDRGEIEVGTLGTEMFPGPVDGPSSQSEEQGFDRVNLLADLGIGLGFQQQPLLNGGRRLAGHGAQHGGVYRHRPPAQADEAQSGGFLLAELADRFALGRILGQKDHAEAPDTLVQACGGGPDSLKQAPGNGAENTCAISGISITTATAAMFHAAEALQGLLQHPVAGYPLEMGQEANPAGILLAGHRLRGGTVAMGPDGRGAKVHGRGDRRRILGPSGSGWPRSK